MQRIERSHRGDDSVVEKKYLMASLRPGRAPWHWQRIRAREGVTRRAGLSAGEGATTANLQGAEVAPD